jgi:uncharacterized protein YxjI
MRFVLRDRIFSLGEDYWVVDEAGNRPFFVDGKALSMRQTFELKGAQGEVYAVAHKKLLAVRDTMVVEAGGGEVARVHRKLISPIHNSYIIELSDGEEWTAKGDIFEKDYTIECPQGVVARTSRQWFRIRDAYGVEIYHPNVPVTLAIVVCVDELVEDHKRKQQDQQHF